MVKKNSKKDAWKEDLLIAEKSSDIIIAQPYPILVAYYIPFIEIAYWMNDLEAQTSVLYTTREQIINTAYGSSN